jgi:hypothetical protein
MLNVGTSQCVWRRLFRYWTQRMLYLGKGYTFLTACYLLWAVDWVRHGPWLAQDNLWLFCSAERPALPPPPFPTCLLSIGCPGVQQPDPEANRIRCNQYRGSCVTPPYFLPWCVIIPWTVLPLSVHPDILLAGWGQDILLAGWGPDISFIQVGTRYLFI